MTFRPHMAFVERVHVYPVTNSRVFQSNNFPDRMMPTIATGLVVLILLPLTNAWTNLRPRSGSKNVLTLHSTALDSESDLLKGTSACEKWFQRVPGAKCLPEVSHENFGNLRGLGISPQGMDLWKKSSGTVTVMQVPKSIVLSSDLTRSDWDATLAQQLWIECTKGPTSSIAGYVSLLTRGWSPADLPQLPPMTAPDALRHWTNDEKECLLADPAGQKLLLLQTQQNQLWRDKFSKVNGMTWEQFQWAMEVVHSRAFCGDFGVGNAPISPLITAAIPAVAAMAGFLYYNNNPYPNDAFLIGLGLVAAAPALVNGIQQAPPVAVLLPMIDSINHLEDAASRIEYSPLSDAFILSLGENCVVDESGKTQLYISYGKKKDTELLLNYGFLTGVPTTGDARTRRKALATAFLARQNSSNQS